MLRFHSECSIQVCDSCFDFRFTIFIPSICPVIIIIYYLVRRPRRPFHIVPHLTFNKTIYLHPPRSSPATSPTPQPQPQPPKPPPPPTSTPQPSPLPPHHPSTSPPPAPAANSPPASHSTRKRRRRATATTPQTRTPTPSRWPRTQIPLLTRTRMTS